MTSQAFPTINGIAPSWADINVTFNILDGTTLTNEDISAIKWSRKVERGEQRGTSGGRVMKRTQGSVTYEASATFYRSGLRRLIKELMAVAPTRGNQALIALVSFDIMVQHTPLGEDELYATKIKGCLYSGESDDMKEGNDADQLEVTLSPLEIANIIDGREVVML